MVTFKLVLLVLAFVLFVLAALGIPSSPPDPPRRWNLIAGGLAAWVLSLLIT